MTVNPLTPRSRQEQEPQRLLRWRRPIPVRQIGVASTVLVSSQLNADYLIEALWGANVTNADVTYSMNVITTGGTASLANATAVNVVMPANMTDVVQGGTGLLLSPGQTLVVTCSVENGMNFFGHGWDMLGDVQQ